MKIQIELIIIAIIGFIFLVWAIWIRWSRKRLLKKYNPNDDKSRKGGVGEVEEPVSSITGPAKLTEPTILPTPTSDAPRKDSSSIGNPLIRRARKRK